MQKNILYFRTPDMDKGKWVDGYTTYGVYFDDKAVSALMTPPPNKEVVENASDLQHGKRVSRDVNDIRKDERNVTLTMFLTAKDKTEFFSRYAAFCKDILDKGFVDIKNVHYPDNVFRMTYLDCREFTEFNMEFAKYQLSFNEPDPTNREVKDKWESE